MQCDAKAKSTGKRCTQKAITGLKKCRFHGAATKASKAKSRRLQAQKKILTELEQNKLTGKATEGTTDALGELQKLTTELIHMKDQLTQRVNRLGDELASYDDKGAEHTKVEIDIYLTVIDKLTKTLDIALKHDIEGKKLAIEQAKAEIVAAVVMRTLIHAGLTGDKLEASKAYLYGELQKIEA